MHPDALRATPALKISHRGTEDVLRLQQWYNEERVVLCKGSVEPVDPKHTASSEDGYLQMNGAMQRRVSVSICEPEIMHV